MADIETPSLLDQAPIEVDPFNFPKAVLDVLAASGGGNADAKSVSQLAYAALQALQFAQKAADAELRENCELRTKLARAA